MSELKAYTPKELVMQGRHNEPIYLKSEADKVIAKLNENHKNEVKQLLILNREQANSANRLRDSMEQVIFRHKYNRCLAMEYEEIIAKKDKTIEELKKKLTEEKDGSDISASKGG